MRVLLINPSYPISETPSPPLSLAVLAAALEQAGIEAAVCDYVVHPYRQKDLEAAIHRSIEENGAWENGCRQVTSDSALEMLSGRIAAPAAARYDGTQIAKTLRYCFSEGFLKITQDAGTVQWNWVDTV